MGLEAQVNGDSSGVRHSNNDDDRGTEIMVAVAVTAP